MISIVVPVYNVESYLGACLDSLLQQDFSEEYEIIAVNDGSTDQSPAILQSYAKNHSNLRILDQANAGLSMARNNGLAMATGEYVLFVDSDDMLNPQSLSLLQEKLDSVGQPDMILFDFRHTDDAGTPGQIFPSTALKLPQDKIFTRSEQPQVIQYQHSAWNKLYRKDFLEDNHLRFVKGIWFEDLPFFHQCILANPSMIYLDAVLYLYRQRPGSIVKNQGSPKNADIITSFNEAIKAYRDQVCLNCRNASSTSCIQSYLYRNSIRLKIGES